MSNYRQLFSHRTVFSFYDHDDFLSSFIGFFFVIIGDCAFSLREYIHKIGRSAIELWSSKWTDRSSSRLWSELISQENDWNGERKWTAYTGEHGGWKRWLTSRAPTCNQGSWFSWWVIVSVSTNFNTVVVLFLFPFFFLFYCWFLFPLGLTRIYRNDVSSVSKKCPSSLNELQQHEEICCIKFYAETSWHVYTWFLLVFSSSFSLLSLFSFFSFSSSSYSRPAAQLRIGQRTRYK